MYSFLRKIVQPPSEAKQLMAVERKPTGQSSTCLVPNLEKKESSFTKERVEKRMVVPILTSSSMQALRSQDHVAADFESAAEDHLGRAVAKGVWSSSAEGAEAYDDLKTYVVPQVSEAVQKVRSRRLRCRIMLTGR
ncbi:hypothetical protein TcWFU_003357 [Taenia crassiceps]|uniref:MICOS complex subunit MIC13 n=1 Tax=Taenia crassiceps TaxID=6207 RepID=A0ABR4QDB9_9CEST